MQISRQIELVIDEMTDEQIGHAFRWYVKETNGQGWEFPKREIRGILSFFRDFILYVKYSGKGQ